MSDAQDQHITCSWSVNGTPCAEVFVFTRNDQEFYAKKGYTNPKYCKTHREMRKVQQKEREEASARREHSPFKPVLDELKERI